MLYYKVKRILLENEESKTRPFNVTQLAAAMDISDRHLRNLMKRGHPEDIERIAKGLDMDPQQLEV